MITDGKYSPGDRNKQSRSENTLHHKDFNIP